MSTSTLRAALVQDVARSRRQDVYLSRQSSSPFDAFRL